MGVKQRVTKEELPLKYQSYNLIETTDGVSHSVYLLDDEYVLKIVNSDELNSLLNEQKLLNQLNDILVPKLLDIIQKDNYILAFYTQIDGETKYTPSLYHIKQIALFLKKFHNISKNIFSTNTKIYEKKYLNKLIIQTNNLRLLEYFNTIHCELKNDGMIHGDLFCDNAKFKDDKLSGVYDFIEACRGDFIFELAVVTISWCFENDTLNKEKTQMLLDTYVLEITYSSFLEYVKYALLYYTTTRYLNNRNYKELLKRLENL